MYISSYKHTGTKAVKPYKHCMSIINANEVVAVLK